METPNLHEVDAKEKAGRCYKSIKNLARNA
jgi:hypothetical protein